MRSIHRSSAMMKSRMMISYCSSHKNQKRRKGIFAGLYKCFISQLVCFTVRIGDTVLRGVSLPRSCLSSSCHAFRMSAINYMGQSKVLSPLTWVMTTKDISMIFLYILCLYNTIGLNHLQLTTI